MLLDEPLSDLAPSDFAPSVLDDLSDDAVEDDDFSESRAFLRASDG